MRMVATVRVCLLGVADAQAQVTHSSDVRSPPEGKAAAPEGEASARSAAEQGKVAAPAREESCSNSAGKNAQLGPGSGKSSVSAIAITCGWLGAGDDEHRTA